MDIEQARILAKLFAQKFIARPDLVANQIPDGTYRPARNLDTRVPTEGFTMENLISHLQGSRTLGHYLINPVGNQTKLFVLDIDLTKGPDSWLPNGTDGEGNWTDWRAGDAREIWQSRQPGPARQAMKFQMRVFANVLCNFIHTELGLKTAAAYSGSKGVHIYGFMPNVTTADRARKAALITLEACGWRLHRGTNVFKVPFSGSSDEAARLPGNFDVEVYPKQDTIDDKDLGNLVRLPLGINLHSPNRDPSFFLDLRAPFTEFVPMDPVEALTSPDIWAYPHELAQLATAAA